MSNIIKLNSYTKGRSIIKGSFLVSTDDPSNCLVTTKTITPQNEFIAEAVPFSIVKCIDIFPFNILGGVYGVYFDPQNQHIYACGDITVTYEDKIYKQVVRFNYNGSFDPSFDITQGYANTPFDQPPTAVRRIGDYVWISRHLTTGYTVGQYSSFTFRSQGSVLGSIHKVDLSGTRDTGFVPYTFGYVGTLWDYYINPDDNCIIMNNWLEVAFRKMSDGSQLASSISGSVNVHGLVIPNTSETPNIMYVCQRTNGGIDSSNTPRALKPINTTTKIVDNTEKTLMGIGLNSPSDNYGFSTGKTSPKGDYMILNRIYSTNANSVGYWNSGTLDQKLFMKVYLPSYTSPNNLSEWNTTGHYKGFGNNGIRGEIMIDSKDRIYVITDDVGITLSNIAIPRNTLVRLNSDCSLDTSFSIVNRLNSGALLYNVVLINDNDILICGDFTSYDSDITKRYILRIDSNGNPLISIPPNSNEATVC
jgi:hypothetical protein